VLRKYFTIGAGAIRLRAMAGDAAFYERKEVKHYGAYQLVSRTYEKNQGADSGKSEDGRYRRRSSGREDSCIQQKSHYR
jgi:hypothetical protein